MKTHEASKEEIILEAAADVFIEKGWNGARMQEIADRAGINKTLLHYYFRSKQNLYDRILKQVFMNYFENLEPPLAAKGSFADSLRAFIDAFIDTTADNPKIPLFLLHELSQGGTTARRLLTDLIASGKTGIPHQVAGLIRRETAAGRIEEVDPLHFLLTLLGACIYFFAAEPMIGLLFVNDPSFDRKRFLEERKESIFRVLYYGVKKREEGHER
jgi:TetR/AcrR family transcriptional regulator